MHIKESIIRARSTTEVVLSMHTPLVPSMHFLNKYSRGTSTSLEYAYYIYIYIYIYNITLVEYSTSVLPS